MSQLPLIALDWQTSFRKKTLFSWTIVGEKGASVNDVIIQINNNEGNWKNLTSSLKFASLGNNISFEILSSNNTFKSIEIESSEIEELTR